MVSGGPKHPFCGSYSLLVLQGGAGPTHNMAASVSLLMSGRCAGVARGHSSVPGPRVRGTSGGNMVEKLANWTEKTSTAPRHKRPCCIVSLLPEARK